MWTLLLILALLTRVSAILFDLYPHKPRCLSDDVKTEVFIKGAYNITEVGSTTVNSTSNINVHVSLRITDKTGEIVCQNFPVTVGKFTFVVDHNDKFTICFESNVTTKYQEKTVRRIDLQVVNTMSFESRREQFEREWKKLNMTRLEKQLVLAQDFSEHLVQQIQENDASMRAVRTANYITGDLFLYISLFGMFALSALTLWQVIYLRNYFLAKKIINN